MCGLTVDDFNVGMVVDVIVDLVWEMPLVDVNFEEFTSFNFFCGCRHQPKRIIQTIRSGVPVATLKVAVLEHLSRPDAAGCPILSAAFFLPGDKPQQTVGDCHVFAPATAQDVAAGAILRDPPLV